MNLTKKLSTLAITGAFLATAGSAIAAGDYYGTSNCQVIYGGGEVCNTDVTFTINKMVGVPNKSDFVENLNVNDANYTANATIPFKIVITNTGKNTISHVRITDTLPSYLTYVSGGGNWDQNARTVTFDLNGLEAGKSQQYILTTKVVSENQLPKDKASVCVINQIQAFEDNGAKATDSSQVCISRVIIPQKNAPVYPSVPVKDIPKTGPEMLPLLGLIPAGLAGLVLRKKARIN